MSQNENCLLRNARSSHFRFFSLPARCRTATGWRRFDRHRLGKGAAAAAEAEREHARVEHPPSDHPGHRSSSCPALLLIDGP
jgi:hypothetical protein